MRNRYEIIGDKAHIYLNRRGKEPLVAVIDASDLPLVEQLPGKLQVHYPTTPSRFYVKALWPEANTKDGKVFLHRYIMQPEADMVVDHIDHNPLNNTRENLRIITQKENTKNKGMSRRNSSGFKGVRWHTIGRKWQAYGRVDGQFKSFGFYEDAHQAAKAVKVALTLHS